MAGIRLGYCCRNHQRFRVSYYCYNSRTYCNTYHFACCLFCFAYAGITYLLWLAYKNLQQKQWQTPETINLKKKTASYFYIRGFVGNILNPQTTIRYFSLLPQFIRSGSEPRWLQNSKLGGLQMLGSTITNVLIVFLVGKAPAGFLQNSVYQKYIRYAISILLAAFALKLLFVKK